MVHKKYLTNCKFTLTKNSFLFHQRKRNIILKEQKIRIEHAVLIGADAYSPGRPFETIP